MVGGEARPCANDIEGMRVIEGGVEAAGCFEGGADSRERR